MKIIKTIFSGFLLIAACAAIGIAQDKAGDKGAPSSTNSNSSKTPRGWQIYNLGAKDGFRIALPKKPESESQEMKISGKTINVTYFTASSDDIFTVIADIYDLPMDAARFTEENKLYLFKKVREGLVEGMKSELDKNGLKPEIKFYTQSSVKLNGLSGYEQDLQVGPIKGRARMLSVKDHIYIFFTMLLDGSKETLVGDFLDSFEYSGAK